MQNYLDVLKKYTVFTGRAARREYWMFVLFSTLASIILSIVDSIIFGGNSFGVLSPLYSLAVLIPSIAVAIRRLHDTNRSGWWLLIGLVPILGVIVLIIFTVQDSDAASNTYGPNPKAVAVV